MQGHPVTILKGSIIVLKKIWMPFRDGFLMILLQAANCTKSLVDQHQREQECQRLAININLKLWTEKAFGSFRGYHRFSTTLNTAQLSSQLKAQNCGALLHISAGSLISLENSVLELQIFDILLGIQAKGWHLPRSREELNIVFWDEADLKGDI